MSKTAESTLVDIYDAWSAHDLDWLGTYLPDDFSHVLNIPPEMHALGGTRHGKRAALERLRSIFEQFDTQQFQTGGIIMDAHGATVQVETRCVHRESGASLSVIKTNVWTLEDGWPVRLSEHYDLDRFRDFMKRAEELVAKLGPLPRLAG